MPRQCRLPTSPASTLVFWRAIGRSGGVEGTQPSATWELYLPAHTAPIDTSWGTIPDVNGDGFADVLVGAPAASGATGQQAFVYLGSTAGIHSTSDMMLAAPGEATERFASVIASAGDIDGDGYADVIVGSPNSNTDPGKAYVYFGGPSGISATPSVTITGSDPSFGTAVSAAGDVNGDGYADVVVGAPGVHLAYAYLGNIDVTRTQATVSSASNVLRPSGVASPSSEFGAAVAGAGDLNGDGFGDIAVGEPGTNNGTGTAFVWYGSSTTPLPMYPNVTLTDPGASAGEHFGAAVGCAGDVNGDGCSDLIVGAPLLNQQGEILVYNGAAGTGINAALFTSIPFPGVGQASFGASVSTAGDIDGDGYSEVMIGSPVPMLSAASGSVYVIAGSSTGITGTSMQVLTPQAATQLNFGSSVPFAGDINGDGHPDAVIGSPAMPSGSGAAFVYVWNQTMAARDGQPATFGEHPCSCGGGIRRLRSLAHSTRRDQCVDRVQNR